MTTKEHIELMFKEIFEFSNIENCWVKIMDNGGFLTISPEYKGNYSIRKNEQVKGIFEDMVNWLVDAELEDSWPDPSAYNLLIYSNISGYEINYAIDAEKGLIEKRRRLNKSQKTVNKYSL